ncbi:VOC family protein [Natrarchaeobius halalkaliphilus]|uniref:VOC family protein n=1 Tax=Natrarchaeobius halalkaliphilus TaxID=1679091 RepID=A0A3N6LP18_9EURY|nr:VOC family protein [Natrarchaeobius halalkaliphilus]RQG87977.1 VOC family protein [Natrarchaeobius halalkaliphilus]
MTDAASLPEGTRVGRTALLVESLEEPIEFYRDVVGLALLSAGETTATLGVDGTPLLVLNRDEEASPRTREQAGLFHTAFSVPSRASLGDALERIRDRWRLDGASDHHVSEALYVTDPEGNGVEIYCDRPAGRWPRTDDGRVRIGTVPLDLEDVAAESSGSARMPAGTTVGHVHLEVSSLEATRAFYVDTIGLCVQTDVGSAVFLAAGDYHHHLGVNAWNDRSSPAGGRGLAWFELVVPDEESLSTVRRRLERTAATVSGRSDGFEVLDPDEIAVRFRAEPSRSERRGLEL